MNKLIPLVLIFGALIIGLNAEAEDARIGPKYDQYCLLCVDHLALEQEHIRDYRDNYYSLLDSSVVTRIALLFDLRLLEAGYWKNSIHEMADDAGRVRAVGWEWEGGVHATKYFDVYWHHHSQHVLDENGPSTSLYYLENEYGVRVNLIGSK